MKHEPTTQATAIVQILSLILAPVRTREISGAVRMQRRMTKTANPTAITTRKIRFCSTNKRSLATAQEKPHWKCRIKCRRFLSPLSSDEETETRDESDISSYAPSKAHNASTRQPTSSRLIVLKGDARNSTMELVGEQLNWRLTSRMAVIYEQQGWEGEIINERHVKQKHGRRCKQYFIQWKQS